MPRSETVVPIWLTHPVTSNATEGIVPNRNDVIAVFKQDVGVISLLKFGTELDMKSLFLPISISFEMLHGIFNDNSRIWQILVPGSGFRLNEIEAEALRDLIVNANSEDTPIREAFIPPAIVQEPEEKPIIEGVSAELIASLQSLQLALQIFSPTLIKKREIESELKKTFDLFENQAIKIGGNNYASIRDRLKDEFQLGTQVMERLDQVGITSPISPNDLTPFERAMIDKFRNYYFEDASIRQAFYGHTGLPQDDNDSDDNHQSEQLDDFEEIVRHYLRQIIDQETGRRLTLFWTHRSASNARDLAASDLIYLTESHASIVIVQHKKLKAGDLSLSNEDIAQKEVLLSICSGQNAGCSNQIEDLFREEIEMRVLDCPVYYSLGSSILTSDYIPACMVNRILEDCVGHPDERRRRLKRTFTRSQFVRSVNRTLIGSSYDEFDGLKQAILERWESNVVALEH